MADEIVFHNLNIFEVMIKFTVSGLEFTKLHWSDFGQLLQKTLQT